MSFMGAAAVITNAAGHILLVKHTYGKLNWEVPGGRVETGESPVDAAIREVREETSLVVNVRHMTGYYFEPETGGLHFVFRCDVVGGAEPMADGSEILECKYWGIHELPRPMSDFTLHRIEHALSGVAYPLPTIVMPRRWLEE